MIAADMSAWSGPIPVEKWRALRVNHGIRLAIPGLWHGASQNAYAGQQLEAASEAGDLLAGYTALSGRFDGEDQVFWALDALPRTRWPDLHFLAIDCELDGITIPMIHEAVGSVRSHNLRPIIYTAAWWWRDRFGDPQDFADLPLWTAQYPWPGGFLPGRPEELLDYLLLYGGWCQLDIKGWQYAGTVYREGVNVDLNWFDDAWLKEDDEMESTEWLLGLERVRRHFNRARAAMNNIEGTWPLSDEEKADPQRQADEDLGWGDLREAIQAIKDTARVLGRTL